MTGDELRLLRRSERSGWLVSTTLGSPAAFHAMEIPERPRREVWLHEPDAPALVVGSTQPVETVDAEALDRRGVMLVRRRSGGGAVLVEPGGLTWIDVILPAGDPLWQLDVGRSFHWLGGVWASALAAVGVEAVVHRGGLVAGPWSSLVCFGGLGPGEVVAAAGPKLVGMAQRRRRAGARFQCAALHRWSPGSLLELLALAPSDRHQAARALSGAAAAVPVPSAQLVEAFLGALPGAEL